MILIDWFNVWYWLINLKNDLIFDWLIQWSINWLINWFPRGVISWPSEYPAEYPEQIQSILRFGQNIVFVLKFSAKISYKIYLFADFFFLDKNIHKIFLYRVVYPKFNRCVIHSLSRTMVLYCILTKISSLCRN